MCTGHVRCTEWSIGAQTGAQNGAKTLLWCKNSILWLVCQGEAKLLKEEHQLSDYKLSSKIPIIVMITKSPQQHSLVSQETSGKYYYVLYCLAFL